MAQPKFTPGPWEIKEWTRRDIDVLGFGARVASVSAWADPAQTMADARLIAAAPDMFEALERVRVYLRSDDVTWEEALDAVNAALAKADGHA